LSGVATVAAFCLPIETSDMRTEPKPHTLALTSALP
jgi:hypothetical protein